LITEDTLDHRRELLEELSEEQIKNVESIFQISDASFTRTAIETHSRIDALGIIIGFTAIRSSEVPPLGDRFFPLLLSDLDLSFFTPSSKFCTVRVK